MLKGNIINERGTALGRRKRSIQNTGEDVSCKQEEGMTGYR